MLDLFIFTPIIYTSYKLRHVDAENVILIGSRIDIHSYS